MFAHESTNIPMFALWREGKRGREREKGQRTRKITPKFASDRGCKMKSREKEAGKRVTVLSLP